MSNLVRIDHTEFNDRLRHQGVDREDEAFICPVCHTVQSMRSLRRAGANPSNVEMFIGFSCEGRLTGAGEWPSDKDKSANANQRRLIRGCNWTLGGLFKIHTLEVTTPDGAVHPIFEIATPEQARALAAEIVEAVDA